MSSSRRAERVTGRQSTLFSYRRDPHSEGTSMHPQRLSSLLYPANGFRKLRARASETGIEKWGLDSGFQSRLSDSGSQRRLPSSGFQPRLLDSGFQIPEIGSLASDPQLKSAVLSSSVPCSVEQGLRTSTSLPSARVYRPDPLFQDSPRSESAHKPLPDADAHREEMKVRFGH